MNILLVFKIVIFISALSSTVLSGYVYNRRANSLSLRLLMGLLLANFIYASSYFFEISAVNVEQIKVFLSLEYLGILFIPIYWVFIAWIYHPENDFYDKKLLHKLRFLYIFPVIANILLWTNDYHHWVYHDISIKSTEAISLLVVDRAAGFWVINIFIIVLYLVGTVRIIFNLIQSHGNHRKQYLLLTFSTIPPFFSYILILTQAVPYNLDLNPIAFALSGILLFWGMDNLQLFNILPVAQKLVVDVIRDAMIVLDPKGRLIECNIPAKSLLEGENADLYKVPLRELNPHLAPLFTSTSDTYEIDLKVPHLPETRTYSVFRSPIFDYKNRIQGDLYLLHDLTQIRSYVKELEHLASSDGLTNLLNHREFMNLANKEASRLQKLGFGNFAIIMFDLDNFKTINDSYGHSAGDKVLQQIGMMVPQKLRIHDICARYGGEEFIILLHDTTIDRATAYAEKLRLAIANLTFTFNKERLHVSASFGVSSFSPENNTSWEIALNHADTALYMAKDAGRNIVKTYELDSH